MKFTAKIFILLVLLNITVLAESYIRADQAQLENAVSEKVTHNKALEHWYNLKTTVNWTVQIKQKGSLKVLVNVANDGNAGSEFQVEIAGQKLKGIVPNTGNWQSYQYVDLGQVKIKKAGKYQVQLIALTRPKRAVMNFKDIKLSGEAAKDIKVLNKASRNAKRDNFQVGGISFERSPGFADRLTELNPTIQYEDISPKFKQFRISGMDFFSDGRMALCTWDGKGTVYILENPNAPKDQHKYTIFAQGLHEALGLKIVKDQIYVVQKTELTKLADNDKDGIADEYICVSNKWPVSANFHEFTFGPLYRNGKFYIALAIAVNPGGATTNPQQKDRGTLIEIDPKTGDYRVIAAGFRTPNGLYMNSKGQIFISDNQGDYLPANKVIHVKKGRFYNHKYQPLHPFASKPVSQPVAWLQQNEIGNSPTQGAFVPYGLYKGQLLLGDIHHGGLKRLFMEKVNGELQSAVFRFTQGLRSGINRMAFDKNNNLYLGACGTRGNWKARGGGVDGLMKVKLYKKDQFEMLAVRAKSNGIEIEFTEPVTEKMAWDKNYFQVSQWTYKPTIRYGGPKINQEKLKITSVAVSKDNKRVFLKLDGMKEKHVLYLRLSNQLRSQKGHKLFVGDCYYTLNQIPNQKPGLVRKKPAHIKIDSVVASAKAEHPGVEVYRTLCMSCHSTDGKKGVGPSLLNLAGSKRKIIKDGKVQTVKADRAFLERALINPAGEVAKGYQPIMPNLSHNMSKKQIKDILDYIESLGVHNKLSKAERKAGWKLLFNGKDFSGWRNFRGQDIKPKWIIENGTMHMTTRGGGDIITDKQYKDFELKLEWKISEAGNSGVFLRTTEDERAPWRTAVEMQVLDNDKHSNGKVAKTRAGSLYDLIAAPNASSKKAGEWNQVHVIVKGSHYQFFLNAVKTADFDVSTEKWRNMINKSKFKTMKRFGKNLKGHIGLQDHADPVWYRNIKIKEL